MLEHEHDPEPITQSAAASQAREISGLPVAPGVRAAFWTHHPQSAEALANTAGVIVFAIATGGLAGLFFVIADQLNGSYFWLWFFPMMQLKTSFQRMLRWVRNRLRRGKKGSNCIATFNLKGVPLGQDEGLIDWENQQLTFDGGATSFAISKNSEVHASLSTVKRGDAEMYILAVRHGDYFYEITLEPTKPFARRVLDDVIKRGAMATTNRPVILPPLWIHDRDWVDKERIDRHWRSAGIGTAITVGIAALLPGFGWLIGLGVIVTWLSVALYMAHQLKKRMRQQRESTLLPQSTIQTEAEAHQIVTDDAMPGISHNHP